MSALTKEQRERLPKHCGLCGSFLPAWPEGQQRISCPKCGTTFDAGTAACDNAFYELTVRQRDDAWGEVRSLRAERDALAAKVVSLEALMIPCGAAEARYRAGGPWGDNEKAALTAVLNACIEAHKCASGGAQ